MASADIGLIGLAVMGSNLALNIAEKGYTIAVHNRTASKIDDFVATAKDQGLDGKVVPEADLVKFIQSVKRPRSIIIMVKAGKPVDDVIEELLPLLDKGDAILECGNSLYTDTQRRFDYLTPKGIGYLGVGVSGGEEGARHGPSIMVGGSKEQWHNAEPVLKAIAAKFNGEPCCAYLGEGGAGHFVKMIHNGIEYGLMQAYAEGFDILKMKASPDLPDDERYTLDMADIAEVWRRGSVISSWLLDLTAQALVTDPELSHYSGSVADSGEGRWTLKAAIDTGVPAPVLSAALFDRFSSQGESAFADKLLSAMRYAFGGHLEKPKA